MATTVTEADILYRLDNLPDGVYLTTGGNEPGSGKPLLGVQSLEEVSLAVTQIPLFFHQVKSFNNDVTSYGLKHILENGRRMYGLKSENGHYISNGVFILAMLVRGYKCKFNGINCVFNVSVNKIHPHFCGVRSF
jgi:hypothetical protein